MARQAGFPEAKPIPDTVKLDACILKIALPSCNIPAKNATYKEID
jgi:hypothetical protein